MKALTSTFSAVGQLWCRAVHRDARWPIHGVYECRRCMRRYRVPWEHEEQADTAEPHAANRQKVPVTA